MVVYGVLKTSDAVSPGVSTAEVITSLVVFTLLYGVLAVIEVRLMAKYAKAGRPSSPTRPLVPHPDRRRPRSKNGEHGEDGEDGDGTDADRPMVFSY